MQLLVEVDDVLLFVGRLGCCLGRLRHDDLGRRRGVVFFLIGVVVEREVVVFEVVFFDLVCVFELGFVEGLLVELGLFLVEVVVAHGCSAPRGVLPEGTAPAAPR